MSKKSITIFSIILLIIFIGTITPFIIVTCNTDGQLDWRDWLTFAGGFISFIGTVFLGFIAYIQNASLHKANEQLEKTSLELTRQDLKMNGFSEIEIKMAVLSNDSSKLHLFFKDVGKFRTTAIKFISCKLVANSSESYEMPFVTDVIYSISTNNKDHDAYFPCDIYNLNNNAKNHINELPKQEFRSNYIGADKNLVLMFEYEIFNTLGVCSTFYGKIILQRTDKTAFMMNTAFSTMKTIEVDKYIDILSDDKLNKMFKEGDDE